MTGVGSSYLFRQAEYLFVILDIAKKEERGGRRAEDLASEHVVTCNWSGDSLIP